MELDLNEKAKQEKDIEVFVEINKLGKRIVGVNKNNKTYYLNSRYDDEILMDNWCHQENIHNYRTIVVVFGMGNGDYIRELRKRNKDMLIVVYEPSYSIAAVNRDMIGMDDLFSDENIVITIGKDKQSSIYGILGSEITYEVVEYVKLYITPNYDNLFPEEYREIFETYKEALQRTIMNRNTMLHFKKKVIDNMIGNFLDCIKQYSLFSLIKVFQNIDKKDIPAIIVSAGPSLDKNIYELKQAKGRAFIIAVDSALNSLGNAGIIPDIAVTVDPNKPLQLFEDKKMQNVPLIFSLSANEKIKSLHHGMRIYQSNENSFLDIYIKKFEKKTATLETGGSVANDAFSLAQKLGFNTIIFVGQDLAYPNDKEHTEGAYKNKELNDINNKPKKYFEVEDIFGGKVKTEQNMNMYRIWFERAVMVYPEIKFIDATEGGAKKKGMEILTLKEAIHRECKSEHDIDFQAVINQIEKYFSEEEQKIILDDIQTFPELMNRVRDRITEGLKAYEKLERLNKKSIYKGEKFEKIIEEITEINDWLTKNNDIAFLHMYVAEKDYQVRGGILDEKENVDDEIKLIIDSGKKMLDALSGATKKAEEDMKRIIVQFKTK